MSKTRKPVNRGFRFDIRTVPWRNDRPWCWALFDRYGDLVCNSAKMFKRQHEAGKDCLRLQDGMNGYVQTFVNGKELKK